jgi:hypothetical protein
MIYKHAMNGLVRQIEIPSANTEIDRLILTEAIATMERLSSQMFTGDLKER